MLFSFGVRGSGVSLNDLVSHVDTLIPALVECWLEVNVPGML